MFYLDSSCLIAAAERAPTKLKKRCSSKSLKRSSKSELTKECTVKKSKSSQSSEQKETDRSSIGGRDNSLFLFRALGKILYTKRTLLNFFFRLLYSLDLCTLSLPQVC